MNISKKVYDWYDEMPMASFGEAVPVTECSVPFGTMKHSRVPMDLAEYGYVEEEFFVTGKAAVYKREKDLLDIEQQPSYYKNRILVRRPVRSEQFSGRVYVDILNATNNFDFEDLWQRIYAWCVKNGHAYVGITSKPVNVQALKLFDKKRYESLQWPQVEENGKVQMQEGAFWDILTQIAEALWYGADSPLKSFGIKRLYLSGQSQSGAYLNTYLANFYELTKKKKIFDGFINLVGVQFSRPVGQDTLPLHFGYREAFQTDVPYLGITSEGDYELFKNFQAGDVKDHIPENGNTEQNKCRYYEVGGAPHYDIECPVIICNNDIKKAGGTPPVLELEKGQELNRFPLRCYITALLEKLHIWVEYRIVPEEAKLFRKDSEGHLCYDQYGNVQGGLRSPFLDLPVAKYRANGDRPETEAIGFCEWMSEKEFYQNYTSVPDYMNRFTTYVSKQVESGWLLEEDGEILIRQTEKKLKDRYENG